MHWLGGRCQLWRLACCSPAVVLLWGKVTGQMEASNNNWVYCAHKGSPVPCWTCVHMIGSIWQTVPDGLGCTAVLVQPQRSWALLRGHCCFTRHPGKWVHWGIHIVKDVMLLLIVWPQQEWVWIWWFVNVFGVFVHSQHRWKGQSVLCFFFF